MPHTRHLLAAGAVLCLTAAVSASRPARDGDATALAFEEARIFLEYTATEDLADVIVQASTVESLGTFSLTGPNGRIHRLRLARGLALGPGDVVLESPSTPLTELMDAYPAGRYVLRGRTRNGLKLVSAVELQYSLPRPPVILHPVSGQVDVACDGLVLEWLPVESAGTVEVKIQKSEGDDDGDDDADDADDGSDEDEEVIRVKIPKRASTFEVPSGLLDVSTSYTMELAVIERCGNRSVTEVEFTTASH